MKVRCIKLVSLEGKELASSPWLKLDGVYDVLSFTAGLNRGVLLRILDEKSAGLFPLQQFEIVDGTIPTSWRATALPTGDISFGPQSWREPGFWERYFDGNEEARKIFDEECRAMGAIAPDKHVGAGTHGYEVQTKRLYGNGCVFSFQL